MNIADFFTKRVEGAKKFVNDPYEKRIFLVNVKDFFVTLLRVLILVGTSFVILSPVIGMVADSFKTKSDLLDPMVFVIPRTITFEKYELVLKRLSYFKTIGADLVYTLTLTAIQVFVCSMVGYGFARFDFPLKKFLFGCVVAMIVIPTHTIMLPLYMTFKGAGLMKTPWPLYIMSIFGTGIRSGLYIYIFNQFFRGLPKEIEEAAVVDGASTWYTYFRIMLMNAMPAVITVTVFSIVWQFNDTFYSSLFQVSDKIVISSKLSSLAATIANLDKIIDTNVQQQYLDAGIILVLLPIVIIYLVLQRYFIEGVERSGIVG